RLVPAVHVPGQVVGVHGAGVRVQVGAHPGAAAGAVADVQPGDAGLEVAVIVPGEAEVEHFEIRQLDAGAGKKFAGRQRRGAAWCLRVLAPVDLAAVQHPGLGVVERVVEGEHHAGQGDHQESTRLNSSHVKISYAVFCLKKKT